ncbi:MAG TPA: hypothetical protein VIJ19_05565 [Opitutaceae bacterium]
MNANNALLFAAFGSIMEIVPRVFPSLFPHCGADEFSCRSLWLQLMGAVQITIGAGFIGLNYVAPLAGRIFSRGRTQEGGALVLPAARGASVR